MRMNKFFLVLLIVALANESSLELDESLTLELGRGKN